MALPSPEEALEWEARQGPRAAIAAAAAAILVIGSGIATAALFNDAPTAGFADSLARAGAEGCRASASPTSSSTTSARRRCC